MMRGLAVLALALAGCAQTPTRTAPAASEAPEPVARCEALYADVDSTVRQAGVRDGGAARIEGVPHLRVNRTLQALAPPANDPQMFDAWVVRLKGLDLEAREIEIANLPRGAREPLERRYADLLGAPPYWPPTLARCGSELARRDSATAGRRDELIRRARVPDDYDTWKRVVGVYWVTRVPFASGVRRHQADVLEVFDEPLDRLPARGRLTTYAPPRGSPLTRVEVAALLEPNANDPLRMSEPSNEALDRLFATFAPVIVVDERDGNDRIGRLVLDERAQARVDLSESVMYVRPAYTRYEGQVLLQLVYSVWFPARPKTGNFDLLGGQLDALVWRVTLAPDGEPVLFDSMHSCGCYHQFFPTPRAQLRPQPKTLDETAFVPERIPRLADGERVVLRVASHTHYLERIVTTTAAPPAQAGLKFAHDNSLRSLPTPDGQRRSAFREDGIVPGSERGERAIFWPMGVREPGAMRQWGRHATAFIGRRHFDEAELVQRYFVLLPL